MLINLLSVSRYASDTKSLRIAVIAVYLRKAHRVMYNLTYLGHRVTLP